MIALILILVVAFVVVDAVQRGDIPVHAGGAMFVAVMVIVGVVWAAGVIAEYRERKRLNRDAFVREVIRAHQRANEVRQATERA